MRRASGYLAAVAARTIATPPERGGREPPPEKLPADPGAHTGPDGLRGPGRRRGPQGNPQPCHLERLYRRGLEDRSAARDGLRHDAAPGAVRPGARADRRRRREGSPDPGDAL